MGKATIQRVPVPSWGPVKYSEKHVYAIKALQEGTADAHQQRTALDWIITVAADTYGESFHPDAAGGERATSFALGRKYVGQKIVGLLNLSSEEIETSRKKSNG